MTGTPKPTIIEIFRTGTFTTRSGDEISFSAADLKAIVDGYDPARHEAPIVIGHPATDAPAHGWVRKIELRGDKLLAHVDQVSPAFADSVRAGRFRRVSAAFYPPNSKSNPRPGQYSLRHVGALGAQPPAVSGLKPLQFAAGDIEFVEFAELSPGALASAFRGLRDWLIGKFGQDEADKALSPWLVDSLQETAAQPDDETNPGAEAPAFSQHEGDMTEAERAALAAKEKDLAAREARLKAEMAAFSEAEGKRRRGDNAAFLDGLISQGRFRAADKARAIEFMERLAAIEGVIEFAEGDSKVSLSMLDSYRRQLKAAPPLVEFGEFAPGGGAVGDRVEFAAPAGAIIDPESGRTHARALAYQRQHPEVDYIQAVTAVSRG